MYMSLTELSNELESSGMDVIYEPVGDYITVIHNHHIYKISTEGSGYKIDGATLKSIDEDEWREPPNKDNVYAETPSEMVSVIESQVGLIKNWELTRIKIAEDIVDKIKKYT